MTYEFYQRPDAVFIIPGQDEDVANSSEPVTYADNLHGDFYIEPIDESEDTNNTYTVQTISESPTRGVAALRHIVIDVIVRSYNICSDALLHVQ